MALDALIILHATSSPGGPSRASAIGGYVGTIPPARFVLDRLRGDPIRTTTEPESVPSLWARPELAEDLLGLHKIEILDLVERKTDLVHESVLQPQRQNRKHRWS